MKDRSQIVLCGLGGQGIVFAARLLGEAAIIEGRDVITSEVHGMAQRGGAVDSTVKIGGFESPLVRAGRADAALAFHASRATWARGFVREGGACFTSCDTAGISPRAANLVLVGLAAGSAPEWFPSFDAIVAAAERLSPPAAVEQNRGALVRGREQA